MNRSISRAGLVSLLAGVMVAGSALAVFGSTNQTVFQGCLSPGGSLTLVTTKAATLTCPSGMTAVSWNQQGQAGPAGGLTAIQEFSASGSFNVPAGVSRLMVEAWGAGGGGSDFLGFPDCTSGGSGGSGGYLRTVLAVTPGETLAVVVGAPGAPASAGGASALKRGTSILVSAGGGGGAITIAGSPVTGGAGGQVVSAGGIARNGHAGEGGTGDLMCQFGPGNPPSTASGVPGVAIQGTVELVSSASAGGHGADFTNGFVAGPGGAGDVILSW